MTNLIGRTKSSPSNHARALMTQSAIRGQFNEAVVLDYPNTVDLFNSSRFVCPRPMPPLSPEHAPSFFANSHFASAEQQDRASPDRGHANQLRKLFNGTRVKDYRVITSKQPFQFRLRPSLLSSHRILPG
ncbi:hypothetical protein D915_009299 [Fasciola hepatica]|uniref:Uncharacterized protein n=1 Tax=Fasciola hepatica TaxID=6192 RepID=A0A4E0RE79_FASHE|nr:hypothetical protein D915_009299 [Fasciola hepatica]